MDIVTNSIVLTLVLPLLSPRKNIPLVEMNNSNPLETILVSPKSNPFADDDMVKKSCIRDSRFTPAAI